MASNHQAAPQQLESRIWSALRAGDLQAATRASNELSRRFPAYGPGWHAASQLAMRIGQAAAALEAIERALKIEPGQVSWLLQRAVCLGRLHRLQELQEATGDIDAEQFTTAYQHSTFGLLLTQLGEREKAIGHYRRAAALEPEFGRHHYNLACLQRTLGRIDEAENSFNRAIELDPDDWEAWKVRSELRTQSKEHNHVQQLEQRLESGVEGPRGEAQICYALAKELEDLGEWQRSFHYLKRGADTRRAHMQYDVRRDIATIDRIIEVFTPAVFSGTEHGWDSTEPIFVLGMPRTGTTLVERILSSHSKVFAAGELNHFASVMMRHAQNLPGAREANRDDLVRLTTQLNFQELGRDYLQSTRPLTGHCPHFIDKMPLNYLYIGLISLALPGARIIHLARHPVDTCYAIYKQLFVDAYPFSYDLQELAAYYAAYERLMAHWQAILPGKIHTVRYETLVDEFEPEARRLVGHCGLAWESACLRFYENTSASTTASSTQVRQPVYRSSVGKWRFFEQELQPLLDALDRAGVAWD